MTPLFFGDSASPLFGALTEPPAGAERGHGVLLCPPIGQEHVRSHWALRQVATALGRAGFHVLRFDWFGVGDSAGDLEAATLERWTQDVKSAAQELKDSTGLRKLSVVGLRMGAALAALAAPRIKPSVMVFWDPVLDGVRYLDQLRSLQAGLVADERRYWFAWPAAVRSALGFAMPELNQARQSGPDELVGFRFSTSLLSEIASLDENLIGKLPRVRAVVLDSTGEPGSIELARALEASGHEVERRVTDARGRWSEAGQIEELLLPGDAVRAITEALVARVA
ncbi:MAG: alpha/beta fold hydrolase [Polyangiaceae bacterium]|nr:alpha/beta fold hydrolase [Polyangiaceae bacterium]